MLLAFHDRKHMLSAFQTLVLVVVDIGSEEEMGRIHARGHVAAVADANICRDVATKQHPCPTMGANVLLVDLGLPVAVLVAATKPQPAARFSDGNPQTVETLEFL